jgi:hypothetical protein
VEDQRSHVAEMGHACEQLDVVEEPLRRVLAAAEREREH